MSDPILVPCLVALRAEFNKKYPNRDKGADGWIGDKAHQQESSDHNPDETGKTPFEDSDHINEVHALDIDANLIPGNNGPLLLNMHVDHIRMAHLYGEDDRLQNIIWQGHIASRSWGWGWRVYTGPSKHYDHAHFSARYTSAQERDTSPWGVVTTVAGVDLNANSANTDVVYGGVNKPNTLTRYDVGAAPTYPVTPNAAAYGMAGGVSTAQRDAATAVSEIRKLALTVATLQADIDAIRQVTDKLDLDPADEPPQENPIVIGTRYAIANPNEA